MKSNTEMSKQIDLEKLREVAKTVETAFFTINADEVLELLNYIAELEKENASLKQDAARYQMIRNNIEDLDTKEACIFDRDGWEIHGLLQGDELDREIDTAMEESNAKAD